MARKKKKETHVNHERWLVSYADFVTLLFAFFVILYATSQTDAEKVKAFEVSINQELSESIIAEFVTQFAYSREDDPRRYLDLLKKKPKFEDRPEKKKSTTMDDSAAPKKAMGATTEAPKNWSVLATLRQDLNQIKLEPKYQKHLNFELDERQLVIRLGEAGFFKSGTPEFTPEAEKVVDSIGALLKKYADVEITIEGHTDNRPVRNSIYRSNWELSTARATIVIAYLINKHAIDPMRLIAAGYGEFRPIASNADPEGQQKNRRVDIIVRNPSDQVQRFWKKTVQRRLEEQKARIEARGGAVPVDTEPDGEPAPTPDPAAVDGALPNPFDAPPPPADQVPTPDGEPAGVAADQTPADHTPADYTPADHTPADQTPVDQTPADLTPVDPAPADPAPADQTPVDPAPADETPADQTPVDQPPMDPAPVDQPPMDPAPADQTPVDSAPADQTPVDPAPAEQTPEDQAPADQAPADQAPADPAPADPAPADPAPADPAPVDPAPADQTPVDETPADQTPMDDAPAEPPPADETPADDQPAEPEPAPPATEDPAPGGQTGV